MVKLFYHLDYNNGQIKEDEKDTNQKVAKYLKEIDYIIEKINKFDSKKDSIELWLLKYEDYCILFNWIEEDRMNRLPYFLEHGLDRAVLNKMKSDNQIGFVELKEFLFDLVGKLVPELSWKEKIFDNLYAMNTYLCENKFRYQDMIYWVNAYLETSEMKNFYKSSSYAYYFI